MTICTRPGCGADFDPAVPEASTSAAACRYHPGAPIFHEGSKSWSCCPDQNKPVLEFDEFIKIPGCATEDNHTAVKQPKQTFANTGSKEEVDLSQGATPEQAAAATTTNGVGKGDAAAAPTPLSGPRLASAQAAASGTASAPSVPEEEDPLDALDEATISKGTACKRRGCKAVYDGQRRANDTTARAEQEQCMHHKGVAIFHEGSKGYACCRRRVLEFDEFLLIEGCTRAQSGHLFVGGTTKAAAAGANGIDNAEEAVDCRIDHYETPADVRVTVYAKGVDMARSRIELKEDAVELSLGMGGSQPAAAGSNTTPLRRYTRVIAPFAAIDPVASTYSVSRFKVDLVLVKQARGQSWPALERGDRTFGYGLTFGRKLDA